MKEVKLRGGFSDRNGIKKENTTIQYKNFDEGTRIELINVTDLVINGCQKHYSLNSIYNDDVRIQNVIKDVLSEVYREEVEYDEFQSKKGMMKIIKATIREDNYDSVLTLIEYIANRLTETYNPEDGNAIYKAYDIAFEREYVGYRFINGQITQITNEIEIDAIEKVNEIKVDAVKEHIDKALHYLSNREKPDYANSIKESIMAVEAVCNNISGKTTLGAALKKLENNGVEIHPALKEGFDKLYGYTCDKDGIRHDKGLGGSKSTYEEAQFMLVSCSAFINYLKSSLKN